MKRILIIRHAKSSWSNPELSDFERPLNNRGKKDLPDMAERLVNSGITIDKFVSSTAKRALKTAIGHAEAFGAKKKDILLKPELYHASVSIIQHVISEMDDKYDTIALFGHNPGFTDAINFLSDLQLDNLPTCAVCGIAFDVNKWKKIPNKRGESFYYDYPKSHSF